MSIILVTKKVRKPCSKVALPPISISQVSLPSVLPVVVDVLVVAPPVPLPPHPVVHSSLSTSRCKVIVDRTWRTRVPSGYCKLFNDINLLSCLASESGKLPQMDSLQLFPTCHSSREHPDSGRSFRRNCPKLPTPCRLPSPKRLVSILASRTRSNLRQSQLGGQAVEIEASASARLQCASEHQICLRPST